MINNSKSCFHAKPLGADCVLICLYMDDVLIFYVFLNVVLERKYILCLIFYMNDFGEADVILGIKLVKFEHGYVLSQSQYAQQV